MNNGMKNLSSVQIEELKQFMMDKGPEPAWFHALPEEAQMFAAEKVSIQLRGHMASILEKQEVLRHGDYAVMEGDIDTEEGGVTACWVEKDGKVISRFSDIDYAEVMAVMHHYADANGYPEMFDMRGIEVASENLAKGRTMLTGQFGDQRAWWVVDSSGFILKGTRHYASKAEADAILQK